MICPECKRLGQDSFTTSSSGSTTLTWSSPFWDEKGSLHTHDSNWTTYDVSCSRGHRFRCSKRNKCPSCDFGGEELVEAQEQPPPAHKQEHFPEEIREMPEARRVRVQPMYDDQFYALSEALADTDGSDGNAQADPQPAVGQIVHYYNHGVPYAALVTLQNGSNPSLVVFSPDNPVHLRFDRVPYAPTPTHGCWSWPSGVRL